MTSGAYVPVNPGGLGLGRTHRFVHCGLWLFRQPRQAVGILVIVFLRGGSYGPLLCPFATHGHRVWRTPFAHPMVKVEVELRRQLGMP